jgi:putative MATE family efflux protein
MPDVSNELQEAEVEKIEHQRHGRDLTVGSIPRLLVEFTLPLLAGSALQAGYTMINRYWVGNFLGADAMAAITISMQVAFIIIAVANGLTLGASIVVAQFVGARNWTGIKRVVDSSMLLIGMLSIVLLILGQVFLVPLLHAINTPPEAWGIALGYMRLFLFSFPLVFISILTTFLLRGTGDSVTPLIFQAISVAITAVLDPLFMNGWLGFPRLGLNGTAVATLITQTLGIVAYFIYLHRKNHIVSPDWTHLRIDWAISKLILKIGLPASAQQLLVSVGSAGVLRIVNGFSENATAGFGAASQVDMLAFFVVMSFSMAISTLAGQNIGAERHDRVQQLFWWGLAMNGSLSLLVSVLAMTVPAVMVGIFLNQRISPEAFHIGVNYLHIVGVSYVILSINFVCIGIINGAGHTMVTTIQSLFSLWIVRIPLAYVLSQRMHQVEGVWYAIVASFAISMLLSLIYYVSGFWKRAVIQQGAPAA